MILDVPDLAAQIRERGQHYAYVPLERRIRDPETGNAAETQLAGAGRLIQLDGLHLDDDIPLAVEYRLVSRAAVPDIAAAGSDDTPQGTWPPRPLHWPEAEPPISGLAAPPPLAPTQHAKP